MGLREAGKAERLRRLKEATKHVLLKHGYDQATTREISELAGVSIGTLFVYAKDKRDLLYLVINDELDPVAQHAHANAPTRGTALDKICALLRPWYEYFAANLAIGRCAFREITYYQHHPEDVDEQAVRLRARMLAQEMRICEIVREARSRGELAFVESATLVGSALYDIYQAEIRAWVYGEAPSVVHGVSRLRSKFSLLLDRMALPDGARDESTTIAGRGSARVKPKHTPSSRRKKTEDT
jgi:AcrR family transcriptional regulator